MQTEAETFYEDALNELGHISALVGALIKKVSEQESDRAIAAELRFQFHQHSQEVIRNVCQAEAGVRAVQIMFDRWMALARARRN